MNTFDTEVPFDVSSTTNTDTIDSPVDTDTPFDVDSPFEVDSQPQTDQPSINQSPTEAGRTVSTEFDPSTLVPSITKVVAGIWTRKDILAKSKGRIRNSISLNAKRDTFDDQPGIFDSKIFGHSKDSVSKSPEEERKRMFNWAHIMLPIPIIRPGLLEKHFLAKVIGADHVLVFKNVGNWNAYIARPLPPTNCDNLSEAAIKERCIDRMDLFLKSYESEIEIASKQGLLTVVELHNSQYGKYNNVVKCEKIIIINKELFSSTNVNRVLGNKTLWKDSFQILPGSIALLDILTDIDIDKEIKYEQALLKLSSNISTTNTNNSFQNLTINKGKQKVIDSASSRLKLLLGLKKQGIEPYELITDVIPVQPAYWRDRTKMVTNGVAKYTIDGINYFYNDLISGSEEINQMLGASLIPYETLISYKKTATRQEKLDIMRQLQTLNFNPALNVTMGNIQNSIFNFLLNSERFDSNGCTDIVSVLKRFSGKTANNRQYVLGKRCDYTARSVITVDPTLNLDEIGIPFRILKVHFKKPLLKALLEQYGMPEKTAEEAIDNMGTKYTNPIKKTGGAINISYTEEDNVNSMENKIYNCLVNILKKHRYLAVRFPSLHKWSQLGYKIKIVYDATIHLNPLVCAGYNADFDGDQMSAWLLSLPESIKEVDEILAPIKNLTDANGNAMLAPGQDMIIGLYILTLKKTDFKDKPVKGTYTNYESLLADIEAGVIDIHDKVQFMNPHYLASMFRHKFYHDSIDKASYRADYSIITDVPTDLHLLYSKPVSGSRVEVDTLNFVNSPIDNLPDEIKYARRMITSTAGRIIFNSIFPQDLGFVKRNRSTATLKDIMSPENFELEWDADIIGVNKGGLKKILNLTTLKYNVEVNGFVRDLFKSEGYRYASESGLSISIEDIETIPGKDKFVEKGWKMVEENSKKYVGKTLRNKNIEAWEQVDKEGTKYMMEVLDDENSLKMMALSGARGSSTQLKQMLYMRGIMMDASNNKVETPILRNFSEGLDPAAFIISSYGACKGIIDRSKNTALTGDTGRHLIYALFHVFVAMGDCGDTEGIVMKDYIIDCGSSTKTVPLSTDLLGRHPIEDIKDKVTGEVLFKKDIPIYPMYYNDIDFDANLAKLQEQYHEDGVLVRSIQSCKSPTGCCARCAGFNYGKNRHTCIGDAIGYMAAQVMSERGTQLTMQTFHTGGVASGDKTAGFGQIMKQLIGGKLLNKKVPNLEASINTITPQDITDALSKTDQLKALLQRPDVRKDTLLETTRGLRYTDMTIANFGIVHADLYRTLFDIYMTELRDAYELNDITFRPVYHEIISRQALSILRVVYSKDSAFRIGDEITINRLYKENLKLLYAGKAPILAVPLLSGCKKIASNLDSPVSAMYFQNVGEVLIESCLRGMTDNLSDPISSMGIGNTLPAGKGYQYYQERISEEMNEPPALISDIIDNIDDEYENITVEDVIVKESSPVVHEFNSTVTDTSLVTEDIQPTEPNPIEDNDDEEIYDYPTMDEIEGFPTDDEVAITEDAESAPESTSSSLSRDEVKGF